MKREMRGEGSYNNKYKCKFRETLKTLLQCRKNHVTADVVVGNIQ